MIDLVKEKTNYQVSYVIMFDGKKLNLEQKGSYRVQKQSLAERKKSFFYSIIITFILLTVFDLACECNHLKAFDVITIILLSIHI